MRRIGQILSECVPLSAHDVAEILEEQKVSRQRFGDAAMALGLAQPQQIWQALVDQLRTSVDPVELTTAQIDPQAVKHVPAVLARKYNALAIRARGDDLVIAVASPLPEDVILQLYAQTKKQLIFIRATARSLETALNRYYPSSVSEAA